MLQLALKGVQRGLLIALVSLILIFSLVLLGTMPDARGVICALVIIVGAIAAATDVNELFGRKAE